MPCLQNKKRGRHKEDCGNREGRGARKKGRNEAKKTRQTEGRKEAKRRKESLSVPAENEQGCQIQIHGGAKFEIWTKSLINIDVYEFSPLF